MNETKKLYLSSKDKKLLGVCGGIAEYLGVDSTVIRLLWAGVTILSGFLPGILAYLLAALIMPPRPTN